MDTKEALVKHLVSAQEAMAEILSYPHLLQVEEYADLTVALGILNTTKKRLSK